MASPSKPEKRKKLRQTATNKLKQGSAPSSHGIISIEALSSLHGFSSTPDNAKDALTLLHELQVHQVELDMQHEQLEANFYELGQDLRQYREMFDYAPIASFIISHDGCIMETNLSGLALLGLEQGEVAGRYFESFLTPASRPAFLELRRQLLKGNSREVCEVQSNAETANRTLRVLANVMPSSESFMLSLVETSNSQKP